MSTFAKKKRYSISPYLRWTGERTLMIDVLQYSNKNKTKPKHDLKHISKYKGGIKKCKLTHWEYL